MVTLRSGRQTPGARPAVRRRRPCASKREGDRGAASSGFQPYRTFYSRHELRGTQWEWVIDAQSYIQTGYRSEMSLKQAALSLFQLHNETINVWSHLVGALLFILLFAHVAINHGIALPRSPLVESAPSDAEHLSALTVRMVGMPLVARGRHTPRLVAMTTFGLDEHGDHIRAAEQHFVNAEGVIDAIRMALPSLDSLRTAVRERVDSVASRGSSAAAAAMDSLDHAVNEVKRSLDRQDSPSRLSRSAEAWTSASEHLGSLHAKLSSAVHSLAEHASVLESSAADILLAEAEIVTSKLSAAAGSSRSALQRIGRASHAVFTEDEEHVDARLGPAEGPSARKRHVPRWPVYVFAASAIFCLMCSAVYHLFYVMNETAAIVFQRVDFAGIAVLIAGSTLPIMYYGFYCTMAYAYSYITLSLLLNGVALVVVLWPQEDSHATRLLRVASFVVAGVSGLVPILHMVVRYGLGDEIMIWFPWTLAQGLLYLGGSWFYASRFPESRFPGRFDIWFSSHQIWHYCVLLAALLHYVGVMELFLWRRQHMCVHEPAFALS